MQSDYSEYISYRSGFIAGTTLSFSLTPIYPTNFIYNYYSYSDPSHKDYMGILYDWKMVGEDMNNSIEFFERETKVDRTRK